LLDRLESLEKTVANLARDLRSLRVAVDRLERERHPATTIVETEVAIIETTTIEREPPRPAVAASEIADPPPQIATTAPRSERERHEPERRAVADRRLPERRTLDFESIVGRYGTLALASLTILLGAGAFLSWAIANGKIGPTARVLLGALAAAVVAAVGWRLRSRGSMRFGSTLLALALALVHVDAWGAGPYLGLVPSPVALGVAAMASAALAVLAWFGEEEALFSVGVGGAVIAPFVTARESGAALSLLAYGFVVLASGLAALRGRTWRTALIVVTAGGWLYVATASATTRHDLTITRDYPAAFALAIAWTALALTGGAWGARIARSALVALFGTLLVQAFDRAPARDLLVLAAVGTASAYAAVMSSPVDQVARARQQLFTAALLPLALGGVAVASVPDNVRAHTLVAIAWTAAAVAMAYLQPAVRPTHVMVAGITSGAAMLFALEGKAVASCVALSAHAAALAILLRRLGTRLVGVPIALGLAIVTTWTFNQLLGRPAYGYTPFLTAPSFAALAMSAAWLVVSWHVSRAELLDGAPGTLETRTLVRLAGSVVTFLWGVTELARAFTPDVSTFLLVLYYAIVGVVAIFVGRARGIRVLRHVGLALAIFAALKAIAQASSLAIGLRVGSYLLAGLFLLAVAYWYRDRELAQGIAPGVASGSESS
jgi:uncharacterized membrane protein